MILRIIAMTSAATIPIVITMSQPAEPCVEIISACSASISSSPPVVGPGRFVFNEQMTYVANTDDYSLPS